MTQCWLLSLKALNIQVSVLPAQPFLRFWPSLIQPETSDDGFFHYAFYMYMLHSYRNHIPSFHPDTSHSILPHNTTAMPMFSCIILPEYGSKSAYWRRLQCVENRSLCQNKTKYQAQSMFHRFKASSACKRLRGLYVSDRNVINNALLFV
ncbi:hypothetical protein BDEG_25667 [Batrachochytrium dendrobatidis JEL423]|uniref:Uncharacterized protein n=1 Tax=Batrachochytrium dendrobatidis (strain JEL423) TaxID=403673 RepID=A0A177WPY4_BATDL|nr:hypothetical protein BDEG_25667 [Batrachochytrium dendrobatidis JEL423]